MKFDAPDALRDGQGIRFHHFHEVANGQLAGTIVTRPHPMSPDHVEVACALVHPNDSGTRRVGRQIAFNRLEVGKSLTMTSADLRALVRERSILATFYEANMVVHMRAASTLRPRRPAPDAAELARREQRKTLRKVRPVDGNAFEIDGGDVLEAAFEITTPAPAPAPVSVKA